MESNELLKKTIAINGTNTQLDVAVEECSELIQAICKIKRYGYTDEDCYFNLAEEMADVEIILAELKLIFDNEDNVKSWKCDKLTRLEKRLESKTDFDTSSGVCDLSK